MNPIVRAVPFVSVLAMALCAMPTLAQTGTKQPATYPALPTEIPAQFKPVNDTFDYTRRTVMIPMRDGVKLHTVILIPSPLSPLPGGEGKGGRAY
jgi:predicted acyl esterase